MSLDTDMKILITIPYVYLLRNNKVDVYNLSQTRFACGNGFDTLQLHKSQIKIKHADATVLAIQEAYKRVAIQSATA